MTTERSYRVRLEANVVGFIAQVGVQAVAAVNKLESAAASAGRQIDKLGDTASRAGSKIDLTQGVTNLDKLATAADKNSQHLDTLGAGATKVGLVAAAGLGVAAKAAIDWESQWAGVTKTVDGSAAQMAELEGQLRGMAKTLPATHQEIAAVAEAAGQLGVRREDIAGFTKVMIDLGETTNLTADEAATSLAQFMNVMQTAPDDVGRLGASLVALGNEGASTERDILSMATRISSTGAIIGLSETQVLGYASALANVGIEAEAGGSAISSVFLRIDKAVSEGGKKLDDFARVSGLTTSQFKAQWETDAAGATQKVIEGLGAMNEAGMDVNGTMETLGITEIRQRAAVLSLAASGDNLAKSLSTASDGWRENTALVEEAEKRYATTESQIRIAWNNIKDSAITAGGQMLPIIADIAKNAADLAQFFGQLPAPVQKTAVALGAIIAVGGLVAGVGLKMVTSLAAARVAMVELGATSARTAAAMSAFTKAGVVGAAVVGLFALTDALDNAFGNVPTGNVSQLATDLVTLGKSAVASGALAERFGESLDGVTRRGPDLKGLGATFKAALGADIPQLDGNAKSVKALDEALASLVQSGNIDGAKAAFEVIASEAAKVGLSLEEVQSLLPEYVSNLGTAQAAAESVGQTAAGAKAPTDAFGRSIGNAGDSAEDAADSLEKWIRALFGMPGLLLSVRDAQRGVQAAIDDATASVKENGKTLDITTEAGRANQAALDEIASAANRQGEAYVRANASQATMTKGALEARAAFVAVAVRMGLTKAAAQDLAEQYIAIPKKVETTVTNNAAAKPLTDAQTYDEQLRGTLPKVNTPFVNNAAGPPLTAAQIYDRQLRGTLPKVQTFVTNTAPVAQGRMDDYLEVLGLTPQAKSTSVSTPGATQAQGQVSGLLGLLGALPSSKTVTVRSRFITERITRQQTTTVTGGHAINADGGYYPQGMFPSYATGELPDEAMIAAGRGSGVVQWAERETGGEAFIPLAESKRARSTEILGKVANEFGLQLAPAAVDPNRYARTPGGWGGGGSGSTPVKEVHNHQTIVNHGVSMAEADLIAQRANAKLELMSRGY